MAPCLTASEISTMRASPVGAFRMPRARTAAATRATTPAMGATIRGIMRGSPRPTKGGGRGGREEGFGPRLERGFEVVDRRREGRAVRQLALGHEDLAGQEPVHQGQRAAALVVGGDGDVDVLRLVVRVDEADDRD